MIIATLQAKANMGSLDRTLRLIMGGVLVYLGLITQSLSDSHLINVLSGIFGITNIVAAIVRVCPGYLVANVSTLRKTSRISTCNKLAPTHAHTRTASARAHDRQAAATPAKDPGFEANNTKSFNRKLLVAITLPVSVVLVIVTFLTLELARKHQLDNKTAAARAIADVALHIESTSDVMSLESVSDEVAAIVFHDAYGNRIPSVIDKLPADATTRSEILDDLGGEVLSNGDIISAGNVQLIKVSRTLSDQGLGVSVYYDYVSAASSILPLMTRLGFMGVLALWLCGWTAFYAIKRYSDYVARNAADIHHRSTHDSLTGLPNRTGLEEILAQQLDGVGTDQKSDQRFALLIIDIANFHYYNDTLGHRLGDLLLKNMASTLQGAIKPGDSVVRLSGDVFAVILNDIDCQQSALDNATQLHQNVCVPMMLEELQVDIQCRIGVAVFPDHSNDAQDLVRLSNIALAQAKGSRQQVYCYEASIDTHSVKKLSILAGLKTAIEEDQFHLAYQPKIDIRTRELHGVEALIRWVHPVHDSVPPIEFIGWAEKSGLINQLTDWVINESESQSQRWQQAGLSIPIAINLSPVNLQDDEVLDRIKSSVTRGFFRGGLLELELTENAVVLDSDNALEKMEAFKALGVPLSIDDFGTGLASFSYLRRFPVSNLKIDRSFVNIANPDAHDLMLLRSMIELGHNLNCVVTAEGVEDEQTLDLLAEYGCDYAQGYHICRPVPADQLLEWVDRENIVISHSAKATAQSLAA